MFQIVMEGVVGKDYKGDIALDDISMTTGPCKVSSSMYKHIVHLKILPNP